MKTIKNILLSLVLIGTILFIACCCGSCNTYKSKIADTTPKKTYLVDNDITFQSQKWNVEIDHSSITIKNKVSSSVIVKDNIKDAQLFKTKAVYIKETTSKGTNPIVIVDLTNGQSTEVEPAAICSKIFSYGNDVYYTKLSYLWKLNVDTTLFTPVYGLDESDTINFINADALYVKKSYGDTFVYKKFQLGKADKFLGIFNENKEDISEVYNELILKDIPPFEIDKNTNQLTIKEGSSKGKALFQNKVKTFLQRGLYVYYIEKDNDNKFPIHRYNMATKKDEVLVKKSDGDNLLVSADSKLDLYYVYKNVIYHYNDNNKKIYIGDKITNLDLTDKGIIFTNGENKQVNLER